MKPQRPMFAFAMACLAASATAAHAQEPISIAVGQVSVVRAKESIGTVAVGNPAIADVAIEGDASVMVFGKKPGQTDLVLMSHGHRQILRSRVVVSTSQGSETIVVRRPAEKGVSEESWYCAPTCARVVEK